MVVSMNNERKAKRKSYFESEGLNSKSNGDFDELLKRKASPDVLASIQQKAEYERQERVKFSIISGIISIVLLLSIVWVVFHFFGKEIKEFFLNTLA